MGKMPGGVRKAQGDVPECGTRPGPSAPDPETSGATNALGEGHWQWQRRWARKCSDSGACWDPRSAVHSLRVLGKSLHWTVPEFPVCKWDKRILPSSQGIMLTGGGHVWNWLARVHPHSQCELRSLRGCPEFNRPDGRSSWALSQTHSHSRSHTRTLGSCPFTPLHTRAVDPARCATLCPSSRNSPQPAVPKLQPPIENTPGRLHCAAASPCPSPAGPLAQPRALLSELQELPAPGTPGPRRPAEWPPASISRTRARPPRRGRR